ncbi:iron uptake cluster protein [Laetiporus sulphureus 93-53]|uniref:Iron uptake cluster protein n=1 Tax=Laetiporus sulphureus 93-53 TaxID=1314785 RepID=A0A165BUV2_9APHY|nr:iron uptake cluster protein [Laetiporus sulphureus 93-53]KZT01697.1 iron uptake cluster protein [Laetiporus sulphureus 93-53]
MTVAQQALDAKQQRTQMGSSSFSRTVAVLGTSYGGARAAILLAQNLPENWRVVVVDRNSHMNHLYVLPRYAILPEHAHKAFIPYNTMFHLPGESPASNSTNAVVLHAQVTSLTPHTVSLSRAFPEHGITEPSRTLHFDYVVYALGSHLPAPIDLWGPVGDEKDVSTVATGVDQADGAHHTTGLSASSTVGVPSAASAHSYQGTKAEGIEWLQHSHDRIEMASSVLVVGGGPLGVQYASDIGEVYPNKHITLLHSRDRLLPAFEESMHKEVMSSMAALNVNVILGERLDLHSIKEGKTVTMPDGKKERVVRTLSGLEIRAELILLCTGQNPNTALIVEAIPDAVISDGPKKGLIRVARTMQIAAPMTSTIGLSTAISKMSIADSQQADENLRVPYPHLFAIGDAVDAFGAQKAGRNSFYQAEVAVRNILKMIERSERGEDPTKGVQLEHYKPGPPGIKITLGLRKMVWQIDGRTQSTMSGVPDMDVRRMWEFYGIDTDDAGMHA